MKKIYIIVVCFLMLTSSSIKAQTFFEEDFENTVGNALPPGWQVTNDPGAVWKSGIDANFLVQYCGSEPHYGRYAGLKPDVAYTTVEREDILTFPPITLQNTVTYTTLTLQMDVLYTGSNDSMLLEISTDNGSNWDVVHSFYQNAWFPTFTVLPTISNTSTLLIRIRHKTLAMGNFCFLSIDNIYVYVPQAVDAEVHNITPHLDSLRDFGTTTQGPIVTARIFNRSMNMLQGFVAKYQVGNGPVQSETITGLSLSMGGSQEVIFTAEAATPDIGANQFKVWVEALGDGDHTNDTFHSVLNGAHFMPVRRPLMEEHGGTWCTWCPRGWVYCDSLDEEYDDLVSIITIHNGDPMTIPAYDAHFNNVIPGGYQVPGSIYDRRESADPDHAFVMYSKYKQYFGFGDVDLGNAMLSGNNLSIEASMKPAIDIDQEFKFLLVLTEDSVHKDAPGYEQINMYSYQNANIPMGGYELLSGVVAATDMWYNHVARQVVGDIVGTSGSLPPTMTNNITYTYTFNATLDPSWDIEQMKAVLMLIKGNDSTVVNTKNIRITTLLGVNTAKTTPKDVIVYPNPASNVVYVSVSSSKASEVTLRLTDMTGRIVYHKQYGVIPANKQAFTVPVKELPSGIYNLQVETAEGTRSKKVNIIN